MRRWLLLTAFSLLALAWASPAVLGATSGVRIEDVTVRRGGRDDLVVGFRVHGALDDRVAETLDSGLPVRFTYWVRIVRPRDFLRDVVVAEHKLVRVLEKDNLKDRFRLVYEGEDRAEDLDRLSSAVEAMARVEAVSVLPLDALGAEEKLQLRIKAQLQEFLLPFRLHYLLPFVAYWDVETEWYSAPLPDSLGAAR
jgi:hypothetical protein